MALQMERHAPGEPPLARLFVNGRWVETAETLDAVDPASGAVVGKACVAGAPEVAAAVRAARAAQPAWAALPWPERRRYLGGLRAAILRGRGELVDLIVTEVGKPRAEAITSDVLVSLECVAYYMQHTGAFLRPAGIGFWEPWFLGKSGAATPRPYGVIAAITPWNFPLSLALSTVIPALAVGNTVVLKPSEEVPLLGARVATLFAEAGFPPGVFNLVNGAAATGRALVNAPVDKVAFTGSTEVGRRILADLAPHLRPAVMELGGKDAMIVLADANLEHAARGAVWGAFVNCGQVCAAVERLYVERAVAEPFITRVVALARELRLGDGRDPHTQLGPLVSQRQRQRVHDQVHAAVAGGARLLCGGEPLNRPGFFYPPTVLVDVPPDAAVLCAETFGPVLPITVVADAEAAVRLANASPFGLSASIWTRDLRRGRALARRIQAGMVTINDHASQWGSMGAPWGGQGDSGYGRVHGRAVLQEFTHPQLVVADALPMRKFWWYPYNPSMLAMFDQLQQARHAGSLLGRLAGWARLVPAFLHFMRGR